jgi:hypothetical protein
LDLGVAAGASDHSTTIHVNEYRQVLALGWGPDVKVQTILILTSKGIV